MDILKQHWAKNQQERASIDQKLAKRKGKEWWGHKYVLGGAVLLGLTSRWRGWKTRLLHVGIIGGGWYLLQGLQGLNRMAAQVYLLQGSNQAQV